ncbi:MAG TPA: septum formation initiator family protein [Candidatus Paceibacterota bacterium]|nr:septum formation initiator family protein [Candidatus Paceibacterota bacterium]
MREFQERRRIKRFLHSRYAIAVLAIVVLVLVRGVWNVYGKYEKSKEIADRMQSDLSSLQSRESSLSKQIDALSTPEGKEREIRDRFGVVKDGEKMVILVDDSTTSTQTAAAANTGFWSRFLGFFGF